MEMNWVSVKKRLPEDGLPEGRLQVTVLICSEAKRVSVASRRYLEEKNKWYWSKWHSNDVTHWMPMPEAPREEE